MMEKNTTCLITGGCGFIGHHLVEHILVNTDWNIVIVDKLSYASSGFNRLREMGRFDSKRIQILTQDFSCPFDVGMVKELADVEYIAHLGAETHVDNSISNALPFVMANVVGTYHMLELARKLPKLKKMCYFSTDEVFGPAGPGILYKEWDRYNSSNPYAATKAGGEELCLAFQNTYKVPVFVTHAMNCFTGDTKIALLEGKNVKIKDLVGLDKFWVYSYDLINKRFIPGEAHSCKMTREKAPVYKVKLDTDEIIKCTGDHLFLMLNGEYKEAQKLEPGDPLMSMRFSIPKNRKVKEVEFFGNEDVYDFTVEKYNNFALSSGVFVHNCFGERQHAEKFIPMTISKVNAGEKVIIHSDKTKTMSGTRFWIHARNAADAVLFLLDKAVAGDKYNIVGEEHSNLEIAQFIATVVGKELNYEMVDFHSSRPGHDLRYSLDGSKLKRMGWVAPIACLASLHKSISWTLDHPEWLVK